MWPIIPLAVVQSLLLALGQVLLKLALTSLGSFSWSWCFFGRAATNLWLLGCGVCYAGGTLLWLYIIRRFPFSVAYPMISLSYVFGLLAAVVIFHERVALHAWIGVGLIMLGCVLIAR